MIRSLLVPACLLGALLLSACEKPTVSVNLHGVNYTGETFSYVVMDPVIPDQGSGGELIDPFGAGGTMCCATLPREWRPGIKLTVRTTHWLKARPDGSLPEIKQSHIVEVPKYVDGKPGELWVLRNADGSVSVVSSDLQPDHAQWPGKIKGWPVPSIEYQRERWELFRKHEADGVKSYLSALEQMKENPDKQAREAWEVTKQYYPSDLVGFSGPDDPKYRDSLRKEYEEGLARSRVWLKNIMDEKP
ncbi:DUF3304 domain-containing protein [Massilia litorea]|uniref:DUF3304 domain-containing protein n=1 Tax=Massilia litorea TaxID=2769491 RepID=A0A7L9UBU1_9BURK|nr:DUF3304 domain-containing protein [Massilia litorea]QOL51635.1 DUF3304 domain-containing protein [Massilia litorea]